MDGENKGTFTFFPKDRRKKVNVPLFFLST